VFGFDSEVSGRYMPDMLRAGWPALTAFIPAWFKFTGVVYFALVGMGAAMIGALWRLLFRSGGLGASHDFGLGAGSPPAASAPAEVAAVQVGASKRIREPVHRHAAYSPPEKG
jgi:hypothetical protein